MKEYFKSCLHFSPLFFTFIFFLCFYFYLSIPFVFLSVFWLSRYRKELLLASLLASVLLIINVREEKGEYTGLLFDNIEYVDGILIKDSQKNSEGATIFLLDVMNVESNYIRSSASFPLQIKSRGAPLLTQYSKISIRVRKTISEWEGRYFLSADPSDILIKRSSTFDTEQKNSFLWLVEKRKKINFWLNEKIDRLPISSASLFRALFLGDSDRENSKVRKIFRKAGLMHVLALSGFHVSVLVSLISLLFKPLLGRYKLGFVSIPLLIFYTFVAGVQPSLLRAVVMSIFASICLFFKLRPSGIKIICMTSVFILVLDPSSGNELGFQLSYLALLGILLFTKIFYYKLVLYLPRYFALALAASLGAQITTAPLLVMYFGVLYPGSLITGILINLPITAFMFLGIFSFFLPTSWLRYEEWSLKVSQEISYQIANLGTIIPELNVTTQGATCIFITSYIIIFLVLYKEKFSKYWQRFYKKR